MFSRNRAIALSVLLAVASPALPQNSDLVQVGPPPIRRAEPPSPFASADDLEKRADELRAQKNYLDAIDYYQAAIKKSPARPSAFNKMGICNLMLQRYKDARKNFDRAIKLDRSHADAYNNLGVVYYSTRDYGKAIKRYQKAIELNPSAASFYSNMGAAYFSKKQFDKAALNYSKAMELDPDVFERMSRAGVQAQLPSPEDRAHYDYVLAKLYAKMGEPDRSLRHLRKAMEEGYKNISNVYKDNEFAELRKDPRFAELMTAKPASLPE